MLKKRLLLTGLLALTISHTAWAQATGTITGRAVDQADAVLPGVTINLKNVDTGATRSTVTNDQGVFSVPALERGTYELSAELTGFRSVNRRIELIAGSTVTADFQLGIAALQENLTVQGSFRSLKPRRRSSRPRSARPRSRRSPW